VSTVGSYKHEHMLQYRRHRSHILHISSVLLNRDVRGHTIETVVNYEIIDGVDNLDPWNLDQPSAVIQRCDSDMISCKQCNTLPFTLDMEDQFSTHTSGRMELSLSVRAEGHRRMSHIN
jgi:hypothetical protein